MSKRTSRTRTLSYRDLSTSSSSDTSDNEISSSCRYSGKKIKTKKAPGNVFHPALSKNHFRFFMISRATYCSFIKFLHSKGLYFLSNNEIALLTRQNIDEAMKCIYKFPTQNIKNNFAKNIVIFLMKYKKEILNDLKNWHENKKLPVIDPERKLLRIYMNDIVDVLLKKQELSNTIINILRNKKDQVKNEEINIILNEIHKNDKLNYYNSYFKYIFSHHYNTLVEILSKKFVFKFQEYAAICLNQQSSFIQPTNKLAISIRNHNTPSNSENNCFLTKENELQLNQQKSSENSVELKLQKKSTVNISSGSLIKACESMENTSSNIDSVTENLKNQKPIISSSDIIIIDDSDDESIIAKPEKNNKVDITSEIFNQIMNNEILLQWDEIKDKVLIKFILNNPNNLQKERTYKKLLMLEPQIFEGFNPEDLRKRKNYLASNYEYLNELCGSEKIKTEEEKTVFNKRITSLQKLMNFHIKMEED